MDPRFHLRNPRSAQETGTSCGPSDRGEAGAQKGKVTCWRSPRGARPSWAWNLVSDTKAVWNTELPFSWDEPHWACWALWQGGACTESSQSRVAAPLCSVPQKIIQPHALCALPPLWPAFHTGHSLGTAFQGRKTLSAPNAQATHVCTSMDCPGQHHLRDTWPHFRGLSIVSGGKNSDSCRTKSSRLQAPRGAQRASFLCRSPERHSEGLLLEGLFL